MSVQATNVVKGTLKLRHQDIATETYDIEVSKLQFYADNPRIYSIVRPKGQSPSQHEIYDELSRLEHVRELKEDIIANGGLIDPLIVRGGDLVVLEGNSRLAAYKFLQSKDPIKWAKARCTVLPKDIDERLVFALLGQYHVKGKKDWVPYEKASFIYRRFKQHDCELSVVASELGTTIKDAQHLVDVVEFMVKHNETDRDRWSYYDEYLKSNKIKKARAEYANLDEFVVKEVRAGHIPTAMDLRDKLPIVCSGPAKVLKRYVEQKLDFENAYESAVDAGGDHGALRRLKKFRDWIVSAEAEEDIVGSNKTVRDKAFFELKEIEKRAQKLKKLLEDSKTKL
jgi:hypothetical protein